jgi:hypothetical protein
VGQGWFQHNARVTQTFDEGKAISIQSEAFPRLEKNVTGLP